MQAHRPGAVQVFQQISHDGWGTIPDELNVTTSAEMFFFGGNNPAIPHIDVSGRTDKTLTLATGQTLSGIGSINGSLVILHRRQPVANQDLWATLIPLVLESGRAVTFSWVKGHSGDRMNDFVDELATVAADAQFGRHS